MSMSKHHETNDSKALRGMTRALQCQPQHPSLAIARVHILTLVANWSHLVNGRAETQGAHFQRKTCKFDSHLLVERYALELMSPLLLDELDNWKMRKEKNRILSWGSTSYSASPDNLKTPILTWRMFRRTATHIVSSSGEDVLRAWKTHIREDVPWGHNPNQTI